ncbi:MAG: tetratricopeptide repeat protein [Saprospiraceae bacterium]
MAKNKQYFRGSSENKGFRNDPNDPNNQQNQEEYGDDTLVDIVEVKENAQDFFEKHQTMLLGGLIGLLLLAGLYLGYKYGYKAPREKAGSEALFQAENQFKKDSFNLALVNPGNGGEGFLDIIENYSGTRSSNLAKYYAGISYLNLGKYDVAIEYLDEYCAHDDVTPITKNGALGDAYAEMNDLSKAKSYYSKAITSNNEFLTPYYLNKLAFLEMKEGNNEAGVKLFKRIKEDFPQSEEAKDAIKYVTVEN